MTKGDVDKDVRVQTPKQRGDMAKTSPTLAGRIEDTEEGIRKELRERVVLQGSEMADMVTRAVASLDIKAEFEAAVVRCIKAIVAREADNIARSQVNEMADLLMQKIKERRP